jgi:MFS family permease
MSSEPVTISPVGEADEPTRGQTAPHSARQWYPGWTMLGLAGAMQYLSAPGQSYSVGAFIDPMRKGLAISTTDFSLAYAVATVLSALLLPYVGRSVDKFGARKTLPIIAAGLGCGCLYMSTISSLTGLYVAFGIVRSLGQGALSLISVWLVGEWFEKKRGMATAIAGLGGGLSVMTIPILNNWLITHYGWNTAWVVLALAVWGVLIIPGILLVRDRPEDIGLKPDGFEIPVEPAECETGFDPTARLAVDGKPDDPLITPTGDSWTVAEVLRDKTFWKLLAVPSTAGFVGTGLVIHQVALMGAHGLERFEAILLMTAQAGFATLMAFPVGWLTDRVESRFILFFAMLCLAGASLLVMTLPFLWLAIVYAMLLGLHGSILRSTGTVVWINFYGRAHQGAVRGVAWSAMILASALGPLPLAVSIDYFGSYRPALLLFIAMPLCAACAVWSARSPKRASPN